MFSLSLAKRRDQLGLWILPKSAFHCLDCLGKITINVSPTAQYTNWWVVFKPNVRLPDSNTITYATHLIIDCLSSLDADHPFRRPLRPPAATVIVYKVPSYVNNSFYSNWIREIGMLTSRYIVRKLKYKRTFLLYLHFCIGRRTNNYSKLYILFKPFNTQTILCSRLNNAKVKVDN